MSKKILKIFGLLLVVGLLFAVAPTEQVMAATITVGPGGDYTTIQAAINAANSGDVITVAAGTYVEQLFINESITLQGAGKTLTFINAPDTLATCDGRYPIICVTNAEPTIEGFTIDGLSKGDPYLGGFVGVLYGDAGGVLQNNLITNIKDADTLVNHDNGNGVFARNDDEVLHTLTIQDNEIRNYGMDAMNLNGGGGFDLPVTPMNINIISNDIFGYVIYTGFTQMDLMVTGPGVTVLIDENQFFDSTNELCDPDYNAASIQVWYVEEFTITDNLFENARVGMEVNGGSGTITGNIVEHDPTCPLPSIIIDDDWNTGVLPNPLTVTGNSITSLSNRTYTEVEVNAEMNWWGSVAGPATGAVVGPVDFDPWCLNETCTPPEPVCTTDCYVDALTGLDTNMGNELTPFKTIQKGINTVAVGGTVHVAAGTYAEHVVIGKPLTLLGPNATINPITGSRVGEAVIDGGGATGIIAQVYNTSNVTIAGFTIQNSGSDLNADGGVGLILSSGVILENNIVQDNSTGIGLLGSSGNTVRNNLIDDNSRYGIVMDQVPGNDALVSPNNIITSNTITDSGRDGIYVGKDSHGQTITSNTISGTTGTTEGTDFEGNGVYFWKSHGNTLTGNTIFNNETYGLEMMGSSPNTINSNNIYGNLDGIRIRASGWPVGAYPFYPFGIGTNTISSNTQYQIAIEVPLDLDDNVIPGILQTIINEAPAGATLLVPAGVFEEDLTITKSVDIIGAGSTQTIVELSGAFDAVQVTADAIGELLIEGIGFTRKAGNTYSADWGAIRVGEAGGHFNSLIFRDVEVGYAQVRNIHLSGTSTYGYLELDSVNIHDAGWYGFAMQGTVDTVVVKDSKFNSNGGVVGACDGIGFNFEGGTVTSWMTIDDSEFKDNLGVGLKLSNAENATITNIIATDNCYGVIITAYNDETAGNIDFINPTITGNTQGGLYMAADTDATLNDVDITGGTITDNSLNQIHIYNNGTDIDGIVSDIDITGVSLTKLLVWEPPVEIVNAELNWWGSADYSVVKSRAMGTVDFSPWCGDAACSVKGWFISGGSIQAAIDAAGPGDTIYVGAGNYTETSALGNNINKPNLHIILMDGVVIQNSSPCFTISSDYTWISTETPGGAKCVPTNSSNGIDVTAGRVNVTIEGLEINGDGQTTGNGIDFAGAITDVVISNNKIHKMDGDGLFFSTTPAVSPNVTDIKGNLFQNNGGVGISNTGIGATTIDARYNSWGDPAGPTGTNGDLVSANVNYDDWTYVKIYMESSGTFWPNIALGGRETITYTFYADMVNVTGLDFTFAYPFYANQNDSPGNYCWWDGCAPIYEIYSDQWNRGLRIFDTTENTTDFAPVSGTSLLDTDTHFGYVRFAAVPIGTMTGTKQLFSVEFTAYTSLQKPIPIYDEVYEIGISDKVDPKILGSELFPDFDRANFGMSPSYGPSSNVFASAILDGTYKGINYPNPFAAGSTLSNYYLTGEERQFSLVISNPPKGGTYAAHLLFNLLGAEPGDVTSFMIETAPGVWTAISLSDDGSGNLTGSTPDGGIPIQVPYIATPYNFKITFAEPGTYPVELGVVYSEEDYVMNIPLIAPGDFIVYETPTITSTTFIGPYNANVPEDVTLTITNPSGLVGPFNLVFEYPAGTTIVYGVDTYTCTTTCPPIPVTLGSASNDLDFVVTIPIAYGGPIAVTLYDTDPAPDRFLAELEETIISYSKVTGTISMQGRTYRGEIPVTLTKTDLPTYGPFNASTINQISNNLVFNNVNGGTYRITTNQARYLDITAELEKTIMITGDFTISTLELKAGDADDNNDIDTADAGIVGGAYGTGDINSRGDLNFDNRVNIQDLALLGGNFGKTSADVYDGSLWTP